MPAFEVVGQRDSYTGPSRWRGGTVLSRLAQSGRYAEFGSAAFGLGQIGMLEYRRSLPIQKKVGTFRHFSNIYSQMRFLSRYLGYTGYGGSLIALGMDINELNGGRISFSRFGYRTTSLGLSIASGVAVGGPAGAVVGGGSLTGVEYAYDKMLLPLNYEIKFQIQNINRAIKNGWYPGK